MDLGSGSAAMLRRMKNKGKGTHVKGFVCTFNKLEARKGFFLNFNDTTSREEHKTIYKGFRVGFVQSK
jgi:hypothetical protein